ncbi:MULTISPECIES: DUF2500 domain-containing protein [unclassified Paenibacillus]|uniref:DUF2500 domain-containing protein n=1 Tax=unclassified Paenibacillus TaxID=185978 RepID=UPI0003E2A2FD|nr:MULTISPECIES: DUF2500 domain-containing protein [unclassified Paenibacillus]ETT50902.1 hypothetical protein C162_11606 [Paenibacillus sp. FSL R7-269]
MHNAGVFNGLYPAAASSQSGFFTEGPFLLKLILLLIAGFVAYTIWRGLKTWMTNQTSPLQSRVVTAVAKRTEVWGGRGHMGTHTSYYVTFEFHNGSRRELEVKPKAYAMIVEGDRGELSYQGSRFKGFVRAGMQRDSGVSR